MSLAPRHLTLAAIAGLILAAGGCSGPETSPPRYDQLVRCNAVTAVVGGSLPSTFPNAGEIRAATGRIAEALANEAATSGKTSGQVVNDIRTAATRLEADARAGDPDRQARQLIEEATRCVSLVPK